MKCCFDRIFHPNSLGHGGEKRTAQILDILTAAGIVLESIEDHPPHVWKSKIGRLPHAIGLARALGVRSYTVELLRMLGNQAARFREFFDSVDGTRLFLWDSVRPEDHPRALIAKEAGFKIVAFPQNLESLVPEQRSCYTGKVSPHWFDEELKMLSLCDQVVTISCEEQWLLRLHGIAADYLPYYPPPQAEDFYRQIGFKRTCRVHDTKARRILVLGTASNPPTRLGMLELMRHAVPALTLGHVPTEFHVAGYGTRTLAEHMGIPDGVVLHGEVSLDELESLMTIVDAALVHQTPTTGCLTKVPELLLAGIPLILNRNAARTWEGWPGIRVYETFGELCDLLAQPLPEALVPERPVEHERRMVEKIRLLAGN